MQVKGSEIGVSRQGASKRCADNPEGAPMRRTVLATPLLATLLLCAGIGAARGQDAAAGEKVFAQCKACHRTGPAARNAVGPVLNGLFGREAGKVEGYRYSAANKNSHLTWEEETFAEYIENPRKKIPGTKMAYAGLKDEQKIKDLIAYLHQFDEAPVELEQ